MHPICCGKPAKNWGGGYGLLMPRFLNNIFNHNIDVTIKALCVSENSDFGSFCLWKLQCERPSKSCHCAFWKHYPCFNAQWAHFYWIFINSSILTVNHLKKYRPIFPGRSDSSNPITFCHTLQNHQLHHSYVQKQPPSSQRCMDRRMSLQKFFHLLNTPGKTDNKEPTQLLLLLSLQIYLALHVWVTRPRTALKKPEQKKAASEYVILI